MTPPMNTQFENKRKISQENEKRPAKKRRGSASIRERERLQIFNDALDQLQSILPLRFPKNKKLHKKQTVQLATKYIEFLRQCVDGRQNWSERHRFMWLMDKEDGDVINAIDAASEKKFMNIEDTEEIVGGENNEYKQYDDIIDHKSRDVAHHSENHMLNGVEKNNSHWTSNNLIQTITPPKTQSEDRSCANMFDSHVIRDGNILKFVRDLDFLPEITAQDVEEVFMHDTSQENFHFQINISPISTSSRSDDSAYGTDLSSHKSP